MSYWIEFSYNKGRKHFDGIARIPSQISDKEAQKLLKKGFAWKLPEELAKEYEKKYKEIEVMEAIDKKLDKKGEES